MTHSKNCLVTSWGGSSLCPAAGREDFLPLARGGRGGHHSDELTGLEIYWSLAYTGWGLSSLSRIYHFLFQLLPHTTVSCGKSRLQRMYCEYKGVCSNRAGPSPPACWEADGEQQGRGRLGSHPCEHATPSPE
jgi:hypothetical protein